VRVEPWLQAGKSVAAVAGGLAKRNGWTIVPAESNAPTWAMVDAWVLAAITNDRPPRAHTLTEVIAIADGINHSVLTESEFTRAIGRLLSANLVGADPEADRYWPTAAGAKIRERWKHGAFGWIDAIPPQLQRLGEPHETSWALPEGLFDHAVRQYMARWPKHT